MCLDQNLKSFLFFGTVHFIPFISHISVIHSLHLSSLSTNDIFVDPHFGIVFLLFLEHYFHITPGKLVTSWRSGGRGGGFFKCWELHAWMHGQGHSHLATVMVRDGDIFEQGVGWAKKVGENRTEKGTNDVFFRRRVAENGEEKERKKEVISKEKNIRSGMKIFSSGWGKVFQ